MSHCHSVITPLGTISYSALFLHPCESCYKIIRLMIQAFNSIIFNSSCPAAVSHEAQSCSSGTEPHHDRPPYCGGGAIYFQATDCGPARLSCCGESEDCFPSAWVQVCSHSFARWWRNNQSRFRDKIIHKMQLQELSWCTVQGHLLTCSRTLPQVASKGRVDRSNPRIAVSTAARPPSAP